MVDALIFPVRMNDCGRGQRGNMRERNRCFRAMALGEKSADQANNEYVYVIKSVSQNFEISPDGVGILLSTKYLRLT